MMSPNLRGSLAILLFLATFGQLVGGCTYDEAKEYCTHGDPYNRNNGPGGFTGPALEGCIVGAHEVGPKYQTVADSDRECNSRFDVTSVAYDKTHASDDEWMAKTNEMIDRNNGCHYGAKGHLRYNTASGMDGTLDAGCVKRMGADHSIDCVPDAGIN